jgi:hypothetical protein
MTPKKFPEKFCEQHHSPHMARVRGGYVRGVTGGGVRRGV